MAHHIHFHIHMGEHTEDTSEGARKAWLTRRRGGGQGGASTRRRR